MDRLESKKRETEKNSFKRIKRDRIRNTKNINI